MSDAHAPAIASLAGVLCFPAIREIVRRHDTGVTFLDRGGHRAESWRHLPSGRNRPQLTATCVAGARERLPRAGAEQHARLVALYPVAAEASVLASAAVITLAISRTPGSRNMVT